MKISDNKKKKIRIEIWWGWDQGSQLYIYAYVYIEHTVPPCSRCFIPETDEESTTLGFAYFIPCDFWVFEKHADEVDEIPHRRLRLENRFRFCFERVFWSDTIGIYRSKQFLRSGGEWICEFSSRWRNRWELNWELNLKLDISSSVITIGNHHSALSKTAIKNHHQGPACT